MTKLLIFLLHDHVALMVEFQTSTEGWPCTLRVAGPPAHLSQTKGPCSRRRGGSTGWKNTDRDSSAPFENFTSSERALPSTASASTEDLGGGQDGREANGREMKGKREQNKAKKKSIPHCKQVGAVAVMNIYCAAV